MKALILAAGRGNRLQPVSDGTPKCMIPIGDRSLMHHQLTALKAHHITDIVIVVGYQQDAVTAHAREIPGLELTFIENAQYASTNTAYSLWLCREHMIDTFLYLNADVLFHPELLGRLLEVQHPNVLALDQKTCGDEEVKAIVSDHTVDHIGKKLDWDASYGEFIGIGKFHHSTNGAFIDHLSYTVNDQLMKNEYFEFALNRLVKETPFHYVDISDVPCIEVDFPEDLREAKHTVLPAIQEFGETSD